MNAPWYMRLISVLLFWPALALAEVDYQSFPHLIPEINTYTGAATHNIPIAVPPGRNGIQPDLAFTYSSYQQNGMIAKGWEIPINFIQRRTKRGVYYGKNEFDFHGQNGKVELVEISGMPDYYRARIETGFSQYRYVSGGNYWEVTHRDGTKYYFGYNPVNGTPGASRQTNSHGTFKWCLAQVQDPNGNYMSLDYFQDQGQVYPSKIDYTGNSNTSLSPTSSVVFEYEAGTRPDTRISYVSKAPVTTARRLAAVKTYALLAGLGDTMALEYRLEYDQSPVNQISLLSKIRIIGTDGSKELPGYTFSYSQGSIGSLVQGPSTNTIDLRRYSLTAFADTNADNLDDLFFSGCVHASNGDGTFANQSCTQSPMDGDGTIYSADLNGDGNTDLIHYVYKDHTDGQGNTYIQKHHLATYLSSGNGSFTYTQTIALEKGEPGHLGNSRYIALVDYNRDGYVDIYQGGKIFPSDATGQLGSPVSFNAPPGMKYLADVNGDGLIDSIDGGFGTRLSKGDGTFEANVRYKYTYPDTMDINPGIGMPEYDSVLSTRFADINNDNMADMALLVANSYYSTLHMRFFLSDGQGCFDYLGGYDLRSSGISGWREPRMIDLNGDGQLDYASINFRETQDSNGDYHVVENYISTGLTQNTAPFDLLTKAVSPSGATLTYTYRRSNEIKNHHHLPFIVYSVATLELDDGVRGDHPRSGFRHELGYYDASEREFRGFEKATQTHPDATVTRTYHFVGPPPGYVSPSGSTFHADDNYYYKGRMRQVDKYGGQGGNPLSTTTMTWGKVEHATDPWAFVRLTARQTTYYDDQTVHTREDYLYDVDFDGLTDDTAGLLREKTNSGTGAGAVVTAYAYHNYHSTWDPLWRKTVETVYDDGQSGSPARRTEYVYNGSTGNLEQKIGVNTDPAVDDSIWRYQYDGNGNLQYEYDANGNPPTEYVSYDATQTYPTLIRNPAGHETQKAWDTRWGLEDWVTDPNGQTTAYTYDAFGRLNRTDFPDQGYTRLIYNDYCAGTDCTTVTLPRQLGVSVRTVGSQTEDTLIYFDGLARKVQTVKNGEGGTYIVSKTLYDDMGRAGLEAGPFFRSSDAFLSWADYSPGNNTPDLGLACPYVHTLFDQRGRPDTQTSRDGQNGLAQTGYEYSGFETTITDPDGCVKTEIRDHLERIREVVEDPAGQDIHTHYSYNAAGDLLTVYNAAEPTASLIRIQYDSLGRKVRMDDPDMGTYTYTYWPNGEVQQQTDAKGQSIQFGYDEINRLESKVYSNAQVPTPSVTYTYDSDAIPNGIGRLHQVTNGDVTTTVNAYDPMGRKAEEQKAISGAATRIMSWTYDYAGRVQRLIYPHTGATLLGGATPLFYVDYEMHPGTSLLHTATGSDGTVYATMTGYQPSGKIGDLDFGNNVRTTYGYDDWSQRLTAIDTAKDLGAGDKHQDRQYYYSKAGDIEQIDDLAWVETYYYSYDKLHRLTSETTSTGSLGVIPGIYEMQYDDPGHLHAVSRVATRGAAHGYTYDENGNMTAGPDLTDIMAVVRRSLTFNADNMPATVAHPTGGTVAITYDGEARRAKKAGPNGTTYYYSNEFEQIGTTETCYIFAGNLRVAMVKDYNYQDVKYFHKDHLGSSSVITDATGAALEQTRFMPFGGKRGEGVGITASGYLFTDQELDKESGLYNYDARLYDPVVGGFVSADSVVPHPYYPQSLNRYGYVYNNPLLYVDPSGHMGDSASLAAAEAGLDIENSDSLGGWTLSNYGDVQMASAGVLSTSSYYCYQTGFFEAFLETLSSLGRTASSLGRTALSGLSATTVTTLAVAGSLVALTPGKLADGTRDFDEKTQDALEVNEEGDPPENMSPPGAGRKGAFGQAKRDNGIPVSKQPDRVGPNKDKRGVTQPGRSYEYDMPNGTTKTIRDDVAGHNNYGPNSRQNRGSHFNDDAGRHYDY